MALLNICGWERGTSAEAGSTSGTQSVQTSVVRTGTYALRTNPTTTAIGYHQMRLFNANGDDTTLNTATVTVRFYFRYATKPSADDEEIVLGRAGTFDKWGVRLGADGKLAVYDNVPTIVATGATVLSADTWYRIEMQAGTSATAAYELKINGVSELSGTMDTTTTNHNMVRLGKATDRNGESVDFFYDDFALRNDTTYPGEGQVLQLLPNANGATQAWTAGTNASDYLEVDETPTDADTTYVKSTGSAGDVALFAMQNTVTAGISGTISAVKPYIRVREDTAVTSANRIRFVSGATTSDGNATNRTAGYADVMRVFATDPDTSAAWTLAGVDGIQVGSIEDNAVAMRITSVALMVEYVPAAGGVEPTPLRMLMGVGS